MALFKCKACGGDIIPNEDKYTGKCEYCGALQTLPNANDEKIHNLLNRANDFRLNCDFDRAIFEYEKVLELDETEPEAHWGIFLSRYGVEYVKDTMTLTYKPTLHRISSTSVFDDVDYQAALKYASFVATEQYKKDAALIESVMKELLLLSANQDPYDIFLSYKELDDVTRQRTDDSYLAHDLYNELTAQGYKVFFAPKSLIGAGLYEPKIYSAIISAKVMIVLGTKPQYLEGVWVKNEWSRFAEAIEHGEEKVLIPVFKNMQAGELPNRIAKYQAYDMTSMTFIEDVKKVISLAVQKQSNVNFDKNASAEDAYLERGYLALEDKNFSQAESFFENVLNLNPHNSQAYFGKLMVEMRISKQAQILTAPKYLKEYANFEKAVRFADQQLKTTLLQYEEKVQYTLDEQEYNKAMVLINKPNPSQEEYNKAIDILKSIHNFKDAKGKEVLCIEKLEDIKKDAVLAEAKSEMTGNDISNYEAAIRLLKSISGWKDADERVIDCEKKIEELKIIEEERICKEKNERIAREHKLEDARKEAQTRAKRNKKIAIIFSTIFVIGFVLFYVHVLVVIPNNKYNQAIAFMDEGNYEEAIAVFEELDGYKDSEERIKEHYYNNGIALMNEDNYEEAIVVFEELDGYKDSEDRIIECRYNNGIVLLDGSKLHDAFSNFSVAGDFKDSKKYLSQIMKEIVVQEATISAGTGNTVGLKSDGTVIFIGDAYYDQCDFDDWTDIVAVSASYFHTVGLKSNGTVVAVGNNYYRECNVTDWTDIIAVSAGSRHTVGLKFDGTVVAVGDNEDGQCEVEDWTDIVAISAGNEHTVGLKSDGTVVAVGNNDYEQCNVSDWTDIVAISAGSDHTVGLKYDGTVVAVGDNEVGACDVENWNNIISISAGVRHTLGLKSDGTVVATEYTGNNYERECDVEDWTDIVTISAGFEHTVGLKSDGTVVAVGNNHDGECNVSSWENIKLPDSK